MMGWDCAVTHFTYGERSRKHRKWIQAGFQDKEVLRSYRPIQYREACTLLMNLIEAPGAFAQYIHRYAAATLTEITYGHKVTGSDDKIVAFADLATRETARAGSPGAKPLALLIQFFPILQHYPLWLPGSGFKVKANEIRGYVKNMMDTPYNIVKESFTTGKVVPCFTSALLEDHLVKNSLSEADEIDIKGAAGVLYGAGTDTSVATMTTFILAMVRNPEMFRKAQEEMDRVVGTDRLPDAEDWESLSYLGCIYKEALRWACPAPLAMPHMCTKSDVYRDWEIPKGSMIFPNVWGMLRDPQMYPDPERFLPERYEGLDKSQLEAIDPRNMVFGFGRRRCPGEMFVERSIYTMMSYIIATMEISRARDEAGREIVPPPDFQPGFVVHPKEFMCLIRPRSEKAVAMIKQMNTLS